MEAIKITVTGAEALLMAAPVLTCGTVGQPVEFYFDNVWDHLTKTAVFRIDGVTKDQINIDNNTVVPWEVMKKPNCVLQIGIYGTNEDGTVVIPTIWVTAGKLLPGADPSGDESADPALPVWEQINKAAVKTVNGVAPDENGNVQVKSGSVQTVNGVSPDENGNIELSELGDNAAAMEQPSSYVNLLDMPFGAVPGGNELRYNGDKTGKTVVEYTDGDATIYFIKLSDSAPLISDLENGYGSFFSDGSSLTGNTDEILSFANLALDANRGFVVAYEKNAAIEMDGMSLTLPEKGTYVVQTPEYYLGALRIVGYTGYCTYTRLNDTLHPESVTLQATSETGDIKYLCYSTYSTDSSFSPMTKRELKEFIANGTTIYLEVRMSNRMWLTKEFAITSEGEYYIVCVRDIETGEIHYFYTKEYMGA